MTGGHLRVVRPPGYRVVPKWSPEEEGKRSLLGVWADVGAAAGDGEDQALIAEDLDRPQYGVAANIVLLLELSYRRQRAVAPLTPGDSGPEDGG
jgi:hypothetical protein